jgi:hypothetical protein
MARWKLSEPHYIDALPPDLDAVEWEYRETDRQTGRERRVRYKVPMYCERDVILSRPGTAQNGDYIYHGDPTPAMTPIDDEARTITDEASKTWPKVVDNFVVGQNFSEALFDMLQKQFSAAASGAKPEPVIASGVSRAEFDALQKQLEQLMVQNSELAEKASKPSIRKL